MLVKADTHTQTSIHMMSKLVFSNLYLSVINSHMSHTHIHSCRKTHDATKENHQNLANDLCMNIKLITKKFIYDLR